MSRAVLIFAPTANSEGFANREQRVLPLRRHMAEWLHAAVGCDATPVIACAAEDRATLAAIIPAQDRLWVTQRGTAFSQRLAVAATDAFSLGFQSLVISTVETAPPAALGAAFDTIEKGGNVVVPSPDGGVSLLGLKEMDVDVLASIHPRQRGLLALLRGRFSRLVVLPAPADDRDFLPVERTNATGTWV